MIATKDRVRIVETRVLSDDWYLLKTTFDFLRRDGVWQRQSRETYDRGDGAVILLFNRQAQTVILTRQFRFPVFVNGHDGMLIEAAAGLLDNASPEAHPRRSGRGNRLFRAERGKGVRSLHEPRLGHREAALFVGEYQAGDRINEGGGVAAEGKIWKCSSCRWRKPCRRFARARSLTPRLSCCCSLSP